MAKSKPSTSRPKIKSDRTSFNFGANATRRRSGGKGRSKKGGGS